MNGKSGGAQISLEIDGKDTTRQEERAQLDLFRSISIGKMIAVIGSGVTTTYGYPSWGEMLRQLVGHLRKMYEEDVEYGKTGFEIKYHFNTYGRKHAANFFSGANGAVGKESHEDYDLTVYGILFPLLTDLGRASIFAKYKGLFGPRMLVSKASAESAFPSMQPPKCNGDHLPQDYSYFLQALAEFIDYLKNPNGNDHSLSKQLLSYSVRNDSRSIRISTDRNFVDPLENLRSALRIHRFATFNYDLEIESLLEDYDYPYETLTQSDARGSSYRQSHLGSVARTISLSQENPSDLISFAAAPTDDDETVIHLHGSVNYPEGMVVSQQEYDAVYIEKYSLRNAFEDARRLMFGGNSILYVGVGMREEDVLRPLRYLDSVVSDRPIYALIPSLDSHEQDLSLRHKIRSAYKIKAVTYGSGNDHIPLLAEEFKVDHPLPKPIIPLHQEKKNIENYISDILLGKSPTLDTEKAPRLFHAGRPYADILLSLAGILSDNALSTSCADDKSLEALRKQREIKKFYDATTGISISIALNNAIDVIAGTAKAWSRRWHIRRADDPRNPNQPGQAKMQALESLHAILPEENLDDDKSRTKYLIRSSIEFKPVVQVVLFTEGSGLAAFTSIAKSALNPYLDEIIKKTVRCHVININHMIAANSILPMIHDAITERARTAEKNTVHVFIIHDADRMFDQTGDETKSLASLYFLHSIEGLSREELAKKKTSVRILFLSRRRRAAEQLCKLFGHDAPIIEEFGREFKGEKHDESKYPAIANIVARYRWPNFVIRSLRRKHTDQNKRDDILHRLESFLSSRIHSVDTKNRQSVFCGAVLDALHAHGQRSMDADERIGLATQHTILKWMFTIRIPVDLTSILIIPEINEIRAQYASVLGIDDDHFVVFIDRQLHDLHYLNFILKVDPLHYDTIQSEEDTTRYVLHEHVARYLAHKRGISIEWMDHREWNSATLCNAMIDGGPLFSEEDYQKICQIYEAFLLSGERRPLHCAYAIIREYLCASNVLHGGLMYPSGNDGRSVLDIHAGRLSRLRSSVTRLKASGKSPTNFEHFELWITNEIGVMKYFQGNFHDAVMLFSECLDFVESEKKSAYSIRGDSIDHDPAIVPRIRINLSMALIERAHFEQASNLIASTIARLDTIDWNIDEHQPDTDFSIKEDGNSRLRDRHHQQMQFHSQSESILLRALSLGCLAQIELLTAKFDKARSTIDEAMTYCHKIAMMNVVGWLYGLSAQIASASSDGGMAGMHWKKALAAARGSHRSESILSLEIAETEFHIRHCGGNRATVLSALSTLAQLEKTAHTLGSHKARVGILLIRARALLFLERTESAREAIIDAICLSLLNGMRLKRVSGLVLMVALMAMRGERDAARMLLRTVKLSATRFRYVRASLDIDRLEREIDMDGSVAAWAGYLSEFPVH